MPVVEWTLKDQKKIVSFGFDCREVSIRYIKNISYLNAHCIEVIAVEGKHVLPDDEYNNELIRKIV